MSILIVAALLGSAAQAQSLEERYTCKYLPDQCKVAPADTVEKTEQQAGLFDNMSLAKSKGAKPAPAPERSAAVVVRDRTPVSTGRTVVRVSRPAKAKCDTSAGAPVSPDDLMITFANGSAELSCTAQSNLLAWAGVVKNPRLGGLRFRIEGHTSAVGSAELNKPLSERRARAVADFLGKNGLKADRLEIKGLGYDRPLDGTDPAADANRRVEAVQLTDANGSPLAS